MATNHVPTYCRICEPQCALVAHVDSESEQVLKLTPNKDHPIHKGFACHKGLNFVQLHDDPDRLNEPQRRTSGKNELPTFESTPWTTATQEIAEKITALQEKYGSDALGFYVGNPSAFNSSGRDAARKFMQAVGAKYTFGSGTQDCSNKFAASEALYGTANLHPIPDFANTDFFLSLGSNPKISHVSFVHMTDPMGALRDIVSRGGKVVHVNPRKIESATRATGEILLVNPDTDTYLLAALIHTIFDEGLADQDHIDAHATGVSALKDFAALYTPEKVAAVVGVDAEQICELAREFAKAPAASVHMSTGVNMGRQGTLAYWLVQMLSLVTGNLGKRGGNIYSPGYFPAATVGKPAKEDPFYESQFGEIRRIVGSLPGNLLADHIEQGLVKGLVVMSGNPLLSMAGESRLREAFKQLEFMLVIDIYPSATSMHADYLLPATDWLERPDINSVSVGFQPQPYVQMTDAVVKPKFERKPEWMIFALLLQALNLPSLLDQEEPDPYARFDRQLSSTEVEGDTLTLERIKSSDQLTVVLPEPDPDTLFQVGVQLEGGKVDCYPKLFKQGIERCADIFAELAEEAPEVLKLITLRTNYMVNSWMHNLPALKRDHALDNPLHIHPDDLARLDLTSGAEVRVATDYGEVIATLKADDDLKPGVVAMTHGWGHGNNPQLTLASNHPGANINAVLPTGPGSFEPLSNMSFMTGVPVTVAPA